MTLPLGVDWAAPPESSSTVHPAVAFARRAVTPLIRGAAWQCFAYQRPHVTPDARAEVAGSQCLLSPPERRSERQLEAAIPHGCDGQWITALRTQAYAGVSVLWTLLDAASANCLMATCGLAPAMNARARTAGGHTNGSAIVVAAPTSHLFADPGATKAC